MCELLECFLEIFLSLINFYNSPLILTTDFIILNLAKTLSVNLLLRNFNFSKFRKTKHLY